jgi:hypothetical protein
MGRWLLGRRAVGSGPGGRVQAFLQTTLYILHRVEFARIVIQNPSLFCLKSDAISPNAGADSQIMAVFNIAVRLDLQSLGVCAYDPCLGISNLNVLDSKYARGIDIDPS